MRHVYNLRNVLIRIQEAERKREHEGCPEESHLAARSGPDGLRSRTTADAYAAKWARARRKLIEDKQAKELGHEREGRPKKSLRHRVESGPSLPQDQPGRQSLPPTGPVPYAYQIPATPIDDPPVMLSRDFERGRFRKAPGG